MLHVTHVDSAGAAMVTLVTAPRLSRSGVAGGVSHLSSYSGTPQTRLASRQERRYGWRRESIGSQQSGILGRQKPWETWQKPTWQKPFAVMIDVWSPLIIPYVGESDRDDSRLKTRVIWRSVL